MAIKRTVTRIISPIAIPKISSLESRRGDGVSVGGGVIGVITGGSITSVFILECGHEFSQE